MKLARTNLFSMLNVHIAGVALLLILNLVLGVRLFLNWSTLHAAGPDQLHPLPRRLFHHLRFAG
jgi:hypothetical protein